MPYLIENVEITDEKKSVIEAGKGNLPPDSSEWWSRCCT